MGLAGLNDVKIQMIGCQIRVAQAITDLDIPEDR